MKTYTYSEVEELLRKQRELCRDEYYKARKRNGVYGSIAHEILNAPSPLPPTEDKEEDLKKLFTESKLFKNTKKDDVPSVPAKDSAPVVSHSCAFNDSIQQLILYWNNEYKHNDYKKETSNNYPSDRWKLIVLGNIAHFIRNLQELLNNQQGVKVSDTRDGHSSNDDGNKKISELREKFRNEQEQNIAGWSNTDEVFEWFKPYLKIPSIDWEGLEKEFYDWKEDYYKKYNWFPTPLEVMNFFKTNIYNHIK